MKQNKIVKGKFLNFKYVKFDLRFLTALLLINYCQWIYVTGFSLGLIWGLFIILFGTLFYSTLFNKIKKQK